MHRWLLSHVSVMLPFRLAELLRIILLINTSTTTGKPAVTRPIYAVRVLDLLQNSFLSFKFTDVSVDGGYANESETTLKQFKRFYFSFIVDVKAA